MFEASHTLLNIGRSNPLIPPLHETWLYSSAQALPLESLPIAWTPSGVLGRHSNSGCTASYPHSIAPIVQPYCKSTVLSLRRRYLTSKLIASYPRSIASADRPCCPSNVLSLLPGTSQIA